MMPALEDRSADLLEQCSAQPEPRRHDYAGLRSFVTRSRASFGRWRCHNVYRGRPASIVPASAARPIATGCEPSRRRLHLPFNLKAVADALHGQSPST